MARGTLIQESHTATSRLGISPSDVHIFDFPVRRFSEHRQEILQTTIDLGRALDPTVVFMPSLADLHQDHAVIANEGCRAFKRTRLLSYELPWNNLSFATQAFSALEERHVAQKISAIAAYESQADRPYVAPEYQRAHLITRGLQVNAAFAECFEVVRWIL
jgi:N-acetylglucosamine malate deacetylase 1